MIPERSLLIQPLIWVRGVILFPAIVCPTAAGVDVARHSELQGGGPRQRPRGGGNRCSGRVGQDLVVLEP